MSNGLKWLLISLGLRKAPPLKKGPVPSSEILSAYFPAAASPIRLSAFRMLSIIQYIFWPLPFRNPSDSFRLPPSQI